ncbi:hypothetical protein RV134_200082 [Roseovarius sp. EC-HK134]|nr:hypothetical protein RV420_200004 [Roseovarius sp. EC-SD190]VVS99539.1 hypothetical protein RV134_200082 [Roseovarius sp. EC-HK134]
MHQLKQLSAFRTLEGSSAKTHHAATDVSTAKTTLTRQTFRRRALGASGALVSRMT